MEENKVKFLCEKYMKEVLPVSQKDFVNRLTAAPDAAFESLINVKLKSQTAALLLSIFLGGWAAGKFYVGEIKAAIIKLVSTFFLGLAGGLLSLLWAPLYFVGAIPIVVWWIVDIVHAKSLAVAVNTQKLFSVLYLYSK